jgi:hypothetical protein
MQNGPWRVDLTLGSAAASMYTRAYTAVHATFALRASESLYFSAGKDSAGNRLRCGATYSVQGRDLDARWWSLTAYKNHRLIPNVLGRYSFSQTTVARGPDGSWKIRVSPQRQPENWLPTGEPSGHMSLLLRFYGPGPELLSNPGGVQLPEIREEGSR